MGAGIWPAACYDVVAACKGPAMIPPTPGADPASRLFGYATPPDGAGPIGPDQAWPVPAEGSFGDVLRGLNPLHHLPVVGTIYRMVTGETIPTTMRIAGAALVGGPLGMLGAGLFGLLEELIRMGPDRSRPPTPAGMAETGSERPMDPLTPGTLAKGEYTTLATTQPEFLQPTQFADAALPGAAPDATRGLAAYAAAAQEWRAGQAWEKGLA